MLNAAKLNEGKGFKLESILFPNASMWTINYLPKSGYKSVGMLLLNSHTPISAPLPIPFICQNQKRPPLLFILNFHNERLFPKLMGFSPPLAFCISPSLFITVKAWKERMFLPGIELKKPRVKHQQLSSPAPSSYSSPHGWYIFHFKNVLDSSPQPLIDKQRLLYICHVLFWVLHRGKWFQKFFALLSLLCLSCDYTAPHP